MGTKMGTCVLILHPKPYTLSPELYPRIFRKPMSAGDSIASFSVLPTYPSQGSKYPKFMLLERRYNLNGFWYLEPHYYDRYCYYCYFLNTCFRWGNRTLNPKLPYEPKPHLGGFPILRACLGVHIRQDLRSYVLGVPHFWKPHFRRPSTCENYVVKMPLIHPWSALSGKIGFRDNCGFPDIRCTYIGVPIVRFDMLGKRNPSFYPYIDMYI